MRPHQIRHALRRACETESLVISEPWLYEEISLDPVPTSAPTELLDSLEALSAALATRAANGPAIYAAIHCADCTLGLVGNEASGYEMIDMREASAAANFPDGPIVRGLSGLANVVDYVGPAGPQSSYELEWINACGTDSIPNMAIYQKKKKKSPSPPVNSLASSAAPVVEGDADTLSPPCGGQEAPKTPPLSYVQPVEDKPPEGTKSGANSAANSVPPAAAKPAARKRAKVEPTSAAK